jgi:hypothetical protein
VVIKIFLYALPEKSQDLLDESLCKYQIPSVCTSREVTFVTGRIVSGHQIPFDALQGSSKSYWTEVCVGIKTLPYPLLGKSQSLLEGNLCRYKKTSTCTSREVTALNGRKSGWLSKTVLRACLGKLQSLLNGRLNDLQSCGISSDSAVFIVREPGESN